MNAKAQNSFGVVFLEYFALCEMRGTKLAVEKSSVMHIATKDNILHFNYTLQGTSLKCADSCIYLGVILFNHLSFKNFWYLGRRLLQPSTSTKIIAYKPLVRPTVEYAFEVWNP